MTWVDVVKGIESIITIAAIVIGGCWTYLRFVHARTAQPRILLTVSGETVRARAGCYLRIKVSAKNRGTPVVRIAHQQTTVAAFAEIPGSDLPQWADLSAFGVLIESDLIEPDEDVEEEHLLRLPSEPQVALKLLFQLQTKAIFAGLGKASLWSTEAIITPKFAETNNGTQNCHPGLRRTVRNSETARQIRQSQEETKLGPSQAETPQGGN